MTRRLTAKLAAAAGILSLPILSEMRVKRAAQPHSDSWRIGRIQPRGSTLLGISFRPLQALELGLDPSDALETILRYQFDIVRLAAYWNRTELQPGRFRFEDLDRQIDTVERAGKKIILCAGGVKSFGYPEYFVPDHHLEQLLPEGRLIGAEDYRSLLAASTEFIRRVVERYRDRRSVIAWQVEHEAVDPLGMEHSWRLGEDFVRREVEAARAADPGKPILMNGFLPTSLPVRAQQWWRTRDQGDSLSVAQRVADIAGIDFYPVHGLAGAGGWSLYLDGGRRPWQQSRLNHLFDWSRQSGKRLMVSEAQAEPWETVTTPPSLLDHVMYSCPPERLIETYNQCMKWRERGSELYAYLFWGAEYWVLRRQQGDGSYLDAFARIIAES